MLSKDNYKVQVISVIFLSSSWAKDGRRASVSAGGSRIWCCFQVCLDRKPFSNHCVDETWLRSGMYYSPTSALYTAVHCDNFYRASDQWSGVAWGFLMNWNSIPNNVSPGDQIPLKTTHCNTHGDVFCIHSSVTSLPLVFIGSLFTFGQLNLMSSF